MRELGQQRIIGIMTGESGETAPDGQSQFFAQLCTIGAKLGLFVYIFSPLLLNRDEGTISGYTISAKTEGWVAGNFPLPHLIYDRAFFSRRDTFLRHKKALRELRQFRTIPFLSYGLPGKWEVQQTLGSDSYYAPYLPDTEQLHNAKVLLRRFKQDRALFLKPSAGTHGKGTLKVVRFPLNEICVKGRDSGNGFVDKSFNHLFPFLRWLKSFMRGRSYLIQPYLELTTSKGEAYDVRSLVQKNGKGQWALTGMVVRRGMQGSITSNLHGGGIAEEARSFLDKEFGERGAERIISVVTELSERIPQTLENHYGNLAELGIDLGIDSTGKVYIIEVNSKPGRSAFLGLPKTKNAAVRNPIAYANFLLIHRRVT